MKVQNLNRDESTESRVTGISKRNIALRREIEVDWTESKKLWNQGIYRRAVELRISSLERAYELAGFTVTGHTPPALSPYFSSQMGHLGVAAWISIANEVGAVPKADRTQLLSSVGNLEVVKALSHSFKQVDLGESSAPSKFVNWAGVILEEESALWPWLERIDTIKTPSGFSDLYPLLEFLGSNHAPDRQSALTVNEEDKASSDFSLQELGIAPHDVIVALHIRELPGGRFDHRSAELLTFLPAIRELTDRGIKVVRFGSAHMTHLPQIPGLIDLVAKLPGDSRHDFAVMSRAIFMISTMSGPVTVAGAMGLPSLVVNATSIARSSITFGPATRYLPKRFLNERDRIMCLSENLKSPLGYWEQALSPAIDRMPRTLDSSSQDILLAAREMLEVVSGEDRAEQSLRNRVDEIRSESGAISFGRFSDSFLARNEDWLR